MSYLSVFHEEGGLASISNQEALGTGQAAGDGREGLNRALGPLGRVLDFISKLNLGAGAIGLSGTQREGDGPGKERVSCGSLGLNQPVDTAKFQLVDGPVVAVGCIRLGQILDHGGVGISVRVGVVDCELSTRQGVHLDSLGARVLVRRIGEGLTGVLRTSLHHDEVVRNGRAAGLVVLGAIPILTVFSVDLVEEAVARFWNAQ